MQYLYRAFRVEVYRNQADLMSAIKCHVPLVGTPDTQEPKERDKDESLKKPRALLRQNPQVKRKKLANELGVGLRTVARYLSEMPDVRYVGCGSLGYWEVIDKDNILI